MCDLSLALKPTGTERSAFVPIDLITLQKWVAACKFLVKNGSWPVLDHKLLEGIVWEDTSLVQVKTVTQNVQMKNRMDNSILESRNTP